MLMDLATIMRTHSMKVNGVLHLGGHLAEEARAYHRGGCGETWFVEADPEVIPAMTQALSRYPNQHAIEACVAEVDGDTRTFHRANNHQSSSLFELGTHAIVAPDVHYVAEFTVETVTVDTLVERHGIRANMAELDLQGGELDALKGAEKFLETCDYLYYETNWTPLYQGIPLIHEMDAWLMGRGFVRYDTMMAGNSGWGDALACRPEALGL